MKKLFTALLDFWSEFKAQVFTLVGLFIAWVLLEGEAKTIVGWATLAAIVIWLAPAKKGD
jgi:hypothetical protein